MEGFLGSWVWGREAAADQGGLGADCLLTVVGGSKLVVILGHGGFRLGSAGYKGFAEVSRPRS